MFDVGAHEGEFASSVRDIGYRGDILSFEPVKETFERLAAAFASDPRWRGLNVALGTEGGETKMNVYTGSVFNSFLPPSEYGADRFTDLAQPWRTETVQVRRLESVVDELLVHVPSARIFLKMDTQGWDHQVLEGAGRRLGSILALQSELSAKPIYAGMTGFADSIPRLNKLGFELTGMFPVARDKDDLRIVEFDCVMINSGATAPTTARTS